MRKAGHSHSQLIQGPVAHPADDAVLSLERTPVVLAVLLPTHDHPPALKCRNDGRGVRHVRVSVKFLSGGEMLAERVEGTLSDGTDMTGLVIHSTFR